jgi:hypothetical protein
MKLYEIELETMTEIGKEEFKIVSPPKNRITIGKSTGGSRNICPKNQKPENSL